ncbi:hypothetical protein SAMN04488505_103672 [Chitinophaga rupis]|uniref:Uncharacterized protein n=1 Tax=Chitinophaga rupis TaxID=573321 RepID=A0A1H7WIY5_9BACT|nr:hypothetical protein SAMN04488505_103672 [Chitinophaga rupis]
MRNVEGSGGKADAERCLQLMRFMLDAIDEGCVRRTEACAGR